MDAGAACAVLWLAIGHHYIKAGDRISASEALIASRQVARKLDRNESAAILMALAGQLAGFDAILATQVFAESVNAYNSIDAAAYKPFRWVQTVRAGDSAAEFSLGVKGIERGVAFTIGQMVSSDPEGATMAVLKLTNERVLGDALAALSGALLKPGK